MSDKATSWAYCDQIIQEPNNISKARNYGQEISCPMPSAGTGKFLQSLAHAVKAKSAVCVGSGAGVTGLYLLSAMPEDAIITTIDTDPEHIQAARDAYDAANIRSSKIRFINGLASKVLPRLTYGTYDLVILGDTNTQIASQVEESLPLIKSGGGLVILNALGNDAVADPARREDNITALREVNTTLLESTELAACILPVGTGVLWATKL